VQAEYSLPQSFGRRQCTGHLSSFSEGFLDILPTGPAPFFWAPPYQFAEEKANYVTVVVLRIHIRSLPGSGSRHISQCGSASKNFANNGEQNTTGRYLSIIILK
jgi:hypothetical protein